MLTVRPATTADIDACARVLALSFQDDPGTMVFEPDPARRAKGLLPFFSTFVAAALSEKADLVVAGEPVAGIASWFGPDRFGPSEEAMGAHGFGDVIAELGPEAAGRLGAMVGELEAQHARLTDGPHLRLEFFGVDPGRQGTGIGGALIEHGHRRADAAGLPCYLETFTETNVRFYERRGYRKVAGFSVGDGVPVHAMIRPPSS